LTGPFIIACASVTGTVPELPEYLRKPLRRGDQFIQLTAAAAHQALVQVVAVERPGERCGLFLGTCFGPMQSNFNVLDALIDQEPVSPTLFSHSVFNAAAGYASRLFGIFGGAWTFTSFTWPFLQGLANADFMLATGRLDRALILQVETYAPLLHDTRRRMIPQAVEEWPPCAVAWVLDREAINPRALSLREVSFSEGAAPPETALDREELLAGDPEAPLDLHPMALPLLLTDLAGKTCWEGEKQITVTARFGKASVCLWSAPCPPSLSSSGRTSP